MSRIRQFVDPMLEVARGNTAGQASILKYGRSINVDNGVATDIWDRANAADAQAIWVAPTTARTHDIVSTSASDDGDPGGVGARTLRIWGLTGWGTNEVNEDITLNGVGNVATGNAYVIIHRMRVLTKGATNTNVGQITATAQTDGTVTAQILVGAGSTQMAILGIPSTQKLFIPRYYANFNRATPAASACDVAMLANPEPDNELLNFIVRHTFGLMTTGTSALIIDYKPYKRIDGPAIIKVQATGSANDLDVSAGFDGILVNN